MLDEQLGKQAAGKNKKKAKFVSAACLSKLRADL
jgi:hypothetical protein